MAHYIRLGWSLVVSIGVLAGVAMYVASVARGTGAVDMAWPLMNEPNNLTAEGSNTRADADVWELFSQAAVDAIRAAGDDRQLLIEPISWSAVDTFGDLHVDQRSARQGAVLGAPVLRSDGSIHRRRHRRP
jgi:hypothetical protein